MANVIPYAFRGELLTGTHNFASGGDSFKLALYTSNPYNTSSTVYSATNEVSASGTGYTTTGSYISNKYQDLLLYACLVNAYGYLKGPMDMLQYYDKLYKEALETYATEQMGRRRRNEYQDGVIRLPIKSESPSTF